MNSDPSNIFVYGLLMSGFKNEAALKLHTTSAKVEPAVIPGMLYDLGSYPAALYSPTHQKNVHGEIVRIKENLIEDALDLLDRFEGIDPITLVGAQYKRMIIPVELDSGTEHTWCYIYNWNSTGLKVIPSGNYRTYITQSNS